MTYTVNFVGIIYFHVCSIDEDFSAFFPDGRNPDGDIPPHKACLFVEAKDHDSDDWWHDFKRPRTLTLAPKPNTTVNVEVLEFEVPERATITFGNDGGKLDLGNVKSALPDVKQLDAGFDLDKENMKIIAKVPLMGGALEAQNFGGAAIVEWTITSHSNPITITAETARETRRITLKSGAARPDIIISNTSDLISKAREKIGRAAREAAERPDDQVRTRGVESAEDAAGGEATDTLAADNDDTHAALYGQLDKDRKGEAIAKSKFPDFWQLRPARSRHAYLNFLRGGEEVPNSKCSPICCV